MTAGRVSTNHVCRGSQRRMEGWIGVEGWSDASSDARGIDASRTIFGWSNVPAMLVSIQCKLFKTSRITWGSHVRVLLNPNAEDLAALLIRSRQEILH